MHVIVKIFKMITCPLHSSRIQKCVFLSFSTILYLRIILKLRTKNETKKKKTFIGSTLSSYFFQIPVFSLLPYNLFFFVCSFLMFGFLVLCFCKVNVRGVIWIWYFVYKLILVLYISGVVFTVANCYYLQ